MNEGGSLIHVSLGWLVLALLAPRLVWGILGPSEARFSAFPPNPVAALAHLRELMTGRVRAQEQALEVARGALSDVIDRPFQAWSLTPAARDVAFLALRPAG